jgi:WD40 repeat protein
LISKDSDEGIDFLNEFYTEMNYEDEKLFKEKDEEN